MTIDPMALNKSHMMALIRAGEKLVFFSTIDQLSTYNANNGLQIKPLKERLYLVALSLFVRKESCLIQNFDTQLQRFADSGMLTLWRRKFIQIDKLNIAETDSGPEMVNAKGRFTLSQLLFAFKFLAALQLLAWMVFALEIITTRIALLKSLMDFFTY